MPLWWDGTNSTAAATTNWLTFFIDAGTATVTSAHASTTSNTLIWPEQTTDGSTLNLQREYLAAVVRAQRLVEVSHDPEPQQAEAWPPPRPAILIGEAMRRAEALLLRNLTPAQRKTYRDNGWFVVVGGNSGQRYRIRGREGISGNVDLLDDGDRVTRRYCAHAYDGALPVADHLLAQKLHLEHDEAAFLAVANVHAIR